MLSPKYFSWMLLSTAEIKAEVLIIFFLRIWFKALVFFKIFYLIISAYSVFTGKSKIIHNWLYCSTSLAVNITCLS